ncbi:cylicin-2 [Stegastes partitus]|uniref:Cylicin-2-like n=1 Tax=Stegastes partitus TaxID=144197 RepID=A0A3B5AZD0_9TELE|nr:PREDICTED: cylicin-2-like [Stegastes partitus]
MAATEASAAPVVQEDGKTPESKPAEAEQPAKNASSETVNSEVVDKDGTAVNSEVVDNKETVNNDTAAAAGTEEGGAAASEEAAPAQSSENASSAEPKTSFLDSFLNKSGLGKVMGGRKKKEQENAAEGGEKEAEKGGEEAAAAEGGAEGEEATEKAAENGEKDDDKKAEKGKPAEAKSTVRDLIRKPVARIFSHRSTEKKDGAATEPQKQVKVRSKSLDRLEDPEALNTTADSTIEEGGAAGGAEGGADGEQKASSSSATTKHMKRWHSFKKLMAQKAHKKSGGGEDGKEDGADGGEGGGDSSTLDSKESGQKRWKLKRSWTFQGLKRDPSMVGISGKAKSSDKDGADKTEEVAAGGAEGGEEAKAEGGAEEAKTEGGDEKAEGGEEDKAAGGGTVTQHANEIWTSFKKRVIPKSKRANTECAAGGEEDATAAAASGEEGAADEGKDGKSAKAKRSHFGRAVSLKNFILRKGKSTSVDMGEGTKEEEEAAEAGEAAEEAGADGEAAAATEEANDKDAVEVAAEKTPAATEEEKNGGEAVKEAEKTPADAPVTNGENGCSNGTAEETAEHNHQDEEKTTGSSPVKKGKEAVKDEANAKIINAVNSGELERAERDSAEPPNGSEDGDTNDRQRQAPAPTLTSDSSKCNRWGDELALAVSIGEEGGEGGESPLNGGCRYESCDQGEREEEEEEEMRKRDLREAAVAIVRNVMSAATDQLERELCVDNGLNGCYDFRY